MPAASIEMRSVVWRLRWRHRLHMWGALGALPIAVAIMAVLIHWDSGGSWAGAAINAAVWAGISSAVVLGYLGQTISTMRGGLTQACNGRIRIERTGDALTIRLWGRSGLLPASAIESLCLYWDGNFDGIRGVVDAMAIRLRTGETLRIPEDAEGFNEITSFATEHRLPMSRIAVE